MFLMKKHPVISFKNQRKCSGFSLVEVIFAIAIFSLLMTVLTGAYLYGQEATVLSGNRSRANFYAKEGMEAVRNIRDNDFENLEDGIYGLTVSDNEWQLVGSQDSWGIFTRTIEIYSIEENKKGVQVSVSWDQNMQREGLVFLEGHFTNWREEKEEEEIFESCLDYCISIGYTGGICRQNSNKCENNDETHEEDGDSFCPGTGGQNVCCCN